MRKATIFAAVVFVVMAAVGIVFPVYSQEQTVQKQISNSVSSEIVSVDLEKSTLVIRTTKDMATMTSMLTAIPVLPETKILKADAVLKLSDLKPGDKVTVKYSSDGLGKVESINVESTEAAPVTK